MHGNLQYKKLIIKFKLYNYVDFMIIRNNDHLYWQMIHKRNRYVAANPTDCYE